MTPLSVFQAVSLVSVSLTVIWSVVKITQAIVTLVARITRMVDEHDKMWQDFEQRHGIAERADAAAN